MKYRDREEHVFDQGRDDHLMLYRVCGECDRLAQIRRVRRGTHHAMSSRSRRREETTGYTGCYGKALRRDKTVVVGTTVIYVL